MATKRSTALRTHRMLFFPYVFPFVQAAHGANADTQSIWLWLARIFEIIRWNWRRRSHTYCVAFCFTAFCACIRQSFYNRIMQSIRIRAFTKSPLIGLGISVGDGTDDVTIAFKVNAERMHSIECEPFRCTDVTVCKSDCAQKFTIRIPNMHNPLAQQIARRSVPKTKRWAFYLILLSVRNSNFSIWNEKKNVKWNG